MFRKCKDVWRSDVAEHYTGLGNGEYVFKHTARYNTSRPYKQNPVSIKAIGVPNAFCNQEKKAWELRQEFTWR